MLYVCNEYYDGYGDSDVDCYRYGHGHYDTGIGYDYGDGEGDMSSPAMLVTGVKLEEAVLNAILA